MAEQQAEVMFVPAELSVANLCCSTNVYGHMAAGRRTQATLQICRTMPQANCTPQAHTKMSVSTVKSRKSLDLSCTVE